MSDERNYQDISLDLLDDFPNHPFALYDKEEQRSTVTASANDGFLPPTSIR
jgi:hypothetical protein